VIELSAEQIATAAGVEIAARGGDGHPSRAVIDSREVRAGDLFIGIRGERADGGEFAAAALRAGAWGAMVEPRRANGLEGGWVFAAHDPLAALQALARAWRRSLAAPVVGVTGSVGKTSVKDICGALLPQPAHASPENFNTEIGLPLAILGAASEARTVVLEMAMRGPGQIAELAAIAEPEVAVITNVGPVHIELLGSVEAIAAVKAEVLAGLPPHGAAVVPVDAGPLQQHLEAVPRLIRFGPGGDVSVSSSGVSDGATEALIAAAGGEAEFRFPFTEAYNLTNALAAVAAGVALSTPLEEMAGRAPDIGFSRLRGERLEISGGIVLLNDCYNANPVSMRAALDHLASLPADGRRVAVLGVMAELGADAATHHAEIGRHARGAGVDLLVGVGAAARDYAPDELVADPAEAAELLAAQLAPGDSVLVKGSRAAGLELVAEELQELLGDRRDRKTGET
jgi:UDP-N-acetylmuramoyl-tripeptide--D-alanyl-D-alanine ligase